MMFASTITTLVVLFTATLLRCTSAHETNTSFMAQGMTGEYLALQPVIDTSKAAFLPPSQGKCPKILKLTAYAFEKLLRIAPNGLTDPNGTCIPANGIERPSIPLRNNPLVRTSRFSLFTAFRARQPRPTVKSLHASIPHTLLQCPNDAAPPFSSVNLASVKDYVIPMLITTLTEIGLPKEFIDDVFGGIKSAITTLHPWYNKHGAKVKKQVNALLSSLTKGYYLQLERDQQLSTASDSTSLASVRTYKFSHCPFLGGALSPAEIKLDMQKLLREAAPMLTEIELAPLQFSSAEHFLTDSHCKLSADHRLMQSIKLSYAFPLKKVPGPYGKGALLPVEVNGHACASMQMYRFLEAESEMQHSDIGRASRLLAGRVVNFLVKNAPPQAYNDPALRRFALQFPSFESRLREMRFKSAVLVARLDMSACPDFVTSDPIDLIVANKPSSFFYCNGFTEKAMDVSHPCYQHTVLKKWGLITQDDMPSDGNASTVFLSGLGNTKSCIYDRSESAAAKFRDSFFELLTSPEPSPEELLEQSPEPSSAPQSADEPVTVPMPRKAKKACFPSHAQVTLRSGRKVEMRSIKIGDEVEVSPKVYSPIILFTHATDTTVSEMVSISTISANVAASSTHLFKVPTGLRAAGLMRLGDVIWVAKNGTLLLEPIRSIRREVMRGLYNPHTKAGTILVRTGDGAAVLASPYTTAVRPLAAHAAMTPLRLAHSLFGVTLPAVSRLFPDTSVASVKSADGMGREKCNGGLADNLRASAGVVMQGRSMGDVSAYNCGVMRPFVSVGQLLFKS